MNRLFGIIVFAFLIVLFPALVHADIATDLKGYWKFDEGSGTVAADSSGNGNTGTLTNGPTWALGKIGNAINFDGINDYVDAGSAATLDDLPAFTISAWINPRSFNVNGFGTIIQKGYAVIPIFEGWVLSFDGSGTGALRFSADYGTTDLEVVTSNIVTNNNWQHIALTWSGSATSTNVKIYRDGAEVTYQTRINGTGGRANDNLQNLFIGNNNLGDTTFDGLIDDARVYSRVLTGTDITELFNFTGPDTIPPVISSGQPTGALPAGTTQTTLSVTTNENATCRYSTTSDVAFSAMTNTFATTGTLSHSTTVSGLLNGQTYNYYVRCQDTAGNANTSDFAITFSIASPPPPGPDITPPTVSVTAPSNNATVSGTISVSADALDNVGITGVQFKLDGTNLEVEDTVSPYSISWNTTSTTNGSHNLAAVARDVAGNRATSTVTVTVSNATGGQNSTLLNIPVNTALDVGVFNGGGVTDCYNAAAITDYSRFTYDPINHQMLMFGGGHASTPRTDVLKFDFSTLAWSSMYASMPTSGITLANINQTTGAWISTGHPIPRHTLDQLTFAKNTGELIMNTRIEGGDSCVGLSLQNDLTWQTIPAKYAHYNPVTRIWSYSTTATVPNDLNTQAFITFGSEYDPVSGMIIQIGNLSSGTVLNTYDPITKTLTQRLATDILNLGYNQNMVYFPPNDKFYYIVTDLDPPNQNRVFEITLNRSNWSASTIQQITTTGTPPPGRETGWAYDSVNQIIGGGITNGVFYAFNPITRVWTSKTMLVQTSSSDRPNWQVFHAIDFDPVDGVFITIANTNTIQFYETMRTWAYRYDGAAPPSDTIFPTVSLTLPLSGSTVSGTVAVLASASDNIGVVGVQFKLDGINLETEDIISPYSVSWNTTTASNGSHTLTAVARDAAGNQTTSTSVSVVVSNAIDITPPTISSVIIASKTSSGATITWITNEASDTQIEYGLTTAYGNQTTLDANLVTSHSQTLTGLSPSTTYNYRVKSKDVAGNLTVSPNFTFITDSGGGWVVSSAIISESVQPKPVAGVWWTDPDLKGSIMRLHAFTDMGSTGNHVYSDLAAWSSNMSYYALILNGTTINIYNWPSRTLKAADIGLGTASFYWSPVNDNVIHYFSGSSLMKYDVATGLKTIVKNFSANFSSLDSDLTKSPTKDGRYFVVGGTKIGGGFGAARWDSQTDTLSPIINNNGNEVLISPNGDYLLELEGRTLGGIKAYNAVTGVFIRSLDPDANYPHSDVIKDSSGQQWIVYQYSLNGEIRKASIPGGQIVTLANEGFLNYHISARQSSGDWVIVSFFTDQAQRDNGPGLFEDEIVRIYLDSIPSNPHWERMVHHRSRAAGNGTSCYWKQPHGSVSPNGQYVMFGSSWLGACTTGTDLLDPYVLDIRDSIIPTPVITNIQVTNISTSTAVINWTTDILSDSQVEYGLTTSYGSQTTLGSTLVTSHSQTLTGLSAGTTYHYRVKSGGVVSINKTFSTQPYAVIDTIAPSAVINLAADKIFNTSIDLSWTAPGDDGNTGTAASYVMKWSFIPITSENWVSATDFTGLPTPLVASTTQTYVAIGLQPNTTYYIAIRTYDESDNLSPISNVLEVKTKKNPSSPPDTINVSSGGGGGGGGGGGYTDSTPPAKPTLVRVVEADSQVFIEWENPKDPDFVRLYITRNNTKSTSPISGIKIFEQLATSTTIINLSNDTKYYFAIFAIDRNNNYSEPLVVEAIPKTGVKSFAEKYIAPIITPVVSGPISFSKIFARFFENPPLFGTKNDNIKILQKLLAKDISTYPEGLITGYFGPLTQRAIERFQVKYGIVTQGTPATTGFGRVGPKTLKKLNEVFENETGAFQSSQKVENDIEKTFIILQEIKAQIDKLKKKIFDLQLGKKENTLKIE